MKFTETENLNQKQKKQILKLWNQEYPIKIALSNLVALEDYLHTLADKHHILLVDEQKVVKGWLIYFIRDNEKFFTLILDKSVQNKGWGSKFLDKAKLSNTELSGWVICYDSEPKEDGENYISPVGFYEKNGFLILPDTTLTKDGIRFIKVVWWE